MNKRQISLHKTSYQKTVSLLSLLFVLAFSMILLGCGNGSTGPGLENGHGNGHGNGNGTNEPGPNEVFMVGQSFTPSTLEVEVGTTVRWENNSSETHTVTSGTNGTYDGNFDSGNVSPGGSYTYTFNEAGTFPYFCIPHPNMTGTITVVE
jgi:plastocyanin